MRIMKQFTDTSIMVDRLVICITVHLGFLKLCGFGSVTTHLPGCFCPRIFSLNIGLNMLHSDIFMSFSSTNMLIFFSPNFIEICSSWFNQQWTAMDQIIAWYRTRYFELSMPLTRKSLLFLTMRGCHLPWGGHVSPNLHCRHYHSS